MGSKPSKGTPKDKRLTENRPRTGKKTYAPDPKRRSRVKKK